MKITTKELVLAGMFAACLAITSQLSIPMPTGVPLTIQIFCVALTGVVLGSKTGFIATLIYVLIGAAGLPVFSGMRGGLAAITSVTGGYILAWPVFAAFSGIRFKTENKTLGLTLTILCALIGLMIDEFTGGLQWCIVGGTKTLGAIMAYSFVAFIPKDAILTVLAIIVGNQIRRRIRL